MHRIFLLVTSVLFGSKEKRIEKMEILQPIQNRLLILGIVIYQSNPLNLKNLLTFFMLLMGALLNCVHLFREADSFKKYTDSVCASLSMIVASILFAILISQTRSLYRLLTKLEANVTKRKLESFKRITHKSSAIASFLKIKNRK